MRTFDEQRGVWRMRKPQDVIARYKMVFVLLTKIADSQ